MDDKNIVTSCKDCAFATWDGNTQIGCMHNITEKVQVQPAYDEDANFFIIPDFACRYSISKDYFGRVQAANPTITIDAMKEASVKANKLRYDLVILSTDLENTLECLNNIKNQSIRPSYIKLVTTEKMFVHNETLINALTDIGCKYKVAYLLEIEPSRDEANLYIQETLEKTPWYGLFWDKDFGHKQYAEALDNLINTEFKTVGVAKIGNTESFFVLKHIHNAIGGTHELGKIPEALCFTI
jgi:hypothetical protein